MYLSMKDEILKMEAHTTQSDLDEEKKSKNLVFQKANVMSTCIDITKRSVCDPGEAPCD